MNPGFDRVAKAQTISDLYIYRRIYEFMANIHAASDKYPPELIGGRIYKHFKEFDTDIAELLRSAPDKENLSPESRSIIREKSRQALNDLLETYDDSSDLNIGLNDEERGYLAYFQTVKEISQDIITDIEAGKYD